MPDTNAIIDIDSAEFSRRLDRLLHVERPRLARLWTYYRNPLHPRRADDDTDRPYRQGQEIGLPPRLTGRRSDGTPIEGVHRKEIVIENDIAWRVDTMVDYLFGKPIVIESAATDPQRRATLTRLLRHIFAANGGIQFLQQLALIGAVYGWVDVLVKFDADAADSPLDPAACATRQVGAPPADAAGTGDPIPDPTDDVPPSSHASSAIPSEDAPTTGPAPQAQADAWPTAPPPPPSVSDPADTGASTRSLDDALQRLARCIRFEIVEPARALPLLCPDDYRQVVAYGQVYERPNPDARTRRDPPPASLFARIARSLFATRSDGVIGDDSSIQVIDLITADHWMRYENGRLRARGANALGAIPLVHVQNLALPFQYAGASDVEPLIPLQDELNTRLSDRASRITLQSFRMYLGKGIDNFTDLPVAPGQMWATDNENADVIEFGGDTSAPSEEAHITDIREAMDKTSGVTPIAAGAIKGRIGRLTSAAALRITLLALLAKTERKRTTYGRAIAEMAALALAWLDRAGLFHTTTEERRIEIHWPSPLPEDETDRLDQARRKSELGIPREIILRELGY